MGLSLLQPRAASADLWPARLLAPPDFTLLTVLLNRFRRAGIIGTGRTRTEVGTKTFLGSAMVLNQKNLSW